MYASWQEMEIATTEKNITIKSDALKREVECTLLVPDNTDIPESSHLLLLNDGQELDALKLKETLEELMSSGRIGPVLVAAIHAGEERIQEYGVAGKPDFKKRGSKAENYNNFIINELLPGLVRLNGAEEFKSTVFAGFSLGGLSALDVVWNNADLFEKAGVFSGSFWWRSKDLTKGYTEKDRIMHTIIRNTAVKPDIKIWLQTGTKDETSDRNKNGIIDSIDDTIDLIRELENKGFKRPKDVQYMEMVGGMHNTETWAKAMPKFLIWAFGR
ncbi:MAG TPA: alpha/beta hydrolase-fold protein [Mucilaginibacter sp.]|nr:alpha/beta hydrolase-fold protein [Mucilaginibacter sp.]